MSLLLAPDALAARRAIVAGTLEPLAAGLRAELEPALSLRSVPTRKALLSRAGGRCAADGTLLRFNPLDARHVCDCCGREYHGEAHDRFRLYWYHLWLAERTLHGAVLGATTDDASARDGAVGLLGMYASQYLHYPNADNVLGPSRPFFSTYLESIWLLQLMLALDLLEGVEAPALSVAMGGLARERLVEPSIALIASYDEGMSNRQVWNNAALLAGAALLGVPALAERAVLGASGLLAHLETALLSDGSWYEGENYHLFAHRGLWYGVQLARSAGIPLPERLVRRFREGFAAPFRTVLPDLTYPSRRDSQYAVSVRQPRFAESLELGLAEHDDDRLAAVLARLYAPDIPRRETGRGSTAADVDRNVGATALGRADLSWRSLLFARETLPASTAAPASADLLEAQGLGVLRRERGQVYVSLDYGHSGGGHGHPDRLNLTLMRGNTRWFDDPGTGSYVDRSLHWYRSTLAHNAPMVDGRSQPRVHGDLLAFDEQHGAGWISATARLAPGLDVVRTLVVLEDYLVDELVWAGDAPHDVSLPFHQVQLVDGSGQTVEGRPSAVHDVGGAEDGLMFLHDLERLDVLTGSAPMRARGISGESVAPLDGWIHSADADSWWRAMAPSAPGVPDRHPVLLVGARARAGRVLSVWSWGQCVAGIEVQGDALIVRRSGGSAHRHQRVAYGWTVEREDIAVALGGLRPRAAPPGPPPHHRPAPEPASLPAHLVMAEPHYRRSEQAWTEAGAPSADVAIAWREDAVEIVVDVRSSDRIFVPVDAENPLDNEPAAINGDGVQLYARTTRGGGAWLLVPMDASTSVGVRAIEGWGALPVRASWLPTESGYRLVARVVPPVGERAIDLDVVVNETAPGRARRRGQLVLSGAEGEFVYLRGDRHDPVRLLRFSLPHV